MLLHGTPVTSLLLASRLPGWLCLKTERKLMHSPRCCRALPLQLVEFESQQLNALTGSAAAPAAK